MAQSIRNSCRFSSQTCFASPGSPGCRAVAERDVDVGVKRDGQSRPVTGSCCQGIGSLTGSPSPGRRTRRAHALGRFDQRAGTCRRTLGDKWRPRPVSKAASSRNGGSGRSRICCCHQAGRSSTAAAGLPTAQVRCCQVVEGQSKRPARYASPLAALGQFPADAEEAPPAAPWPGVSSVSSGSVTRRRTSGRFFCPVAQLTLCRATGSSLCSCGGRRKFVDYRWPAITVEKILAHNSKFRTVHRGSV